MKVVHYINRLLIVTNNVSSLKGRIIVLNHEDCQELIHLNQYSLSAIQQWCEKYWIKDTIIDYRFEYLDSVLPFTRLESFEVSQLFRPSDLKYEKTINNSDGSSLDLDMTKLEAMLDRKIRKMEALFSDDLK